MLESCRNAQERWGGVHQLIDRWLGERRELVLAYSALAKAPQAPAINSESLQGFCELLIGGISALTGSLTQQPLQALPAQVSFIPQTGILRRG